MGWTWTSPLPAPQTRLKSQALGNMLLEDLLTDGLGTQSLEMGLASHDRREKFALGLGKGCKHPALVSCEGKHFLSSLGWASHWASPGPLTTSWKCCSWPQGCRECPGEETVRQVPVPLGLCGVVSILHVVFCSYYSQTFSKDT